MKIILISPYPDINSFGIRTISACLKQQGHNVQLLFLTKRFAENYKDTILNEVVELSKDADLIGISLMTNFFDSAVQITKKLKENCDTPILWGGVHPTVRPEECLNYVDIVCIGESEESIIELSSKMENEKYYHDIKGMGFKYKKRLIINQPRKLIQNLDNIPFQDHDYRTHFILNNGQIQKMNIEHLKLRLGVTYTTIPTRGCPFKCTYCCNNTINKMYPNQKPPRKRSMDNIIKELTEIKNRLPFIRAIKFDDDSFFCYSIEEIKEFSLKYKENIGLSLVITGVNPLTLNREKLSILIDAGLYGIRMGIQTGSKNTKKLYNRHHSNQKVEKSAKIINEFKDKIITTQYDIILDNPWETEDDLIETLIFLSKFPIPYALSLYSLTFYPGTELYEKAKAEGILNDELKNVYRKHFHTCKKKYLNRLFFLLSNYARLNFGIPSNIMILLTSQKVRQSNNLNKLSYIVINFFILLSELALKVKRLIYLLHKGIQVMQKGDYSRLGNYIKRRIIYSAKK